jgi:hypothetical protein
MKRFTVSEVARFRELADLGLPANAIAKAIGHTPEAVRHKAVALGIKFRPLVAPKFGSRFKIPDRLWHDVSVAAAKRGVKPTKLAHLALEAVARDGLWDAVIDAPRKSPTAPPPKRRRALPLSLSQLLAPTLEGRVAGGELEAVLDGPA